VRRGVLGGDAGLVHLRALRRRGRSRDLVIKPPARAVTMCVHEMRVACALGADKPLMVDLDALTHGVTVIGEIRAATGGNHRLGSPRAPTGRVQDQQCDPPGFRGCYSAGQQRARGAVQQTKAPPLDAVPGEVHLPTSHQPIGVGSHGFVGRGRRVLWGAGFPHVRHIVRELPSEGHDAPPVRTESSGWPSRLQRRHSPASGWRLCR
jgi:hypothetical protein